MSNRTEEIDRFLEKLVHPMKSEIEAVRALILGANTKMTEHVKWNAPSFCYLGEDRITFHLRAKAGIQWVFHRGAKVREAGDFEVEDETGLLKWA